MRRGEYGSLDGSESDDPLDVAALRADDEFIEALVAGRIPGRTGQDSADDELVAMLAAWVADVRPETLSGEPTMPIARPVLATLPPAAASSGTGGSDNGGSGEGNAGTGGARHSAPPRYARRMAVAAAMVVLASSGLAVGAWDAQPGQVLWPVAKVFYAERAASVEAAADVTTELAQARTALKQGNRAAAVAAVTAVHDRLGAVRPDEGHASLAQEHDQLAQEMGLPPADAAPQVPNTSIYAEPAPSSSHRPGSSAEPPAGPAYTSIPADPRPGAAPPASLGAAAASAIPGPASPRSAPPAAAEQQASPPAAAQLPASPPAAAQPPASPPAASAPAAAPPTTNPPASNPPASNPPGARAAHRAAAAATPPRPRRAVGPPTTPRPVAAALSPTRRRTRHRPGPAGGAPAANGAPATGGATTDGAGTNNGATANNSGTNAPEMRRVLGRWGGAATLFD